FWPADNFLIPSCREVEQEVRLPSPSSSRITASPSPSSPPLCPTTPSASRSRLKSAPWTMQTKSRFPAFWYPASQRAQSTHRSTSPTGRASLSAGYSTEASRILSTRSLSSATFQSSVNSSNPRQQPRVTPSSSSSSRRRLLRRYRQVLLRLS